MNTTIEIINKIKNNQFIVGIVGLGYVGLPLAVSFASKNVKTIGFEKSVSKAEKVNQKINYIGDVNDQELIDAVDSQSLEATTDSCFRHFFSDDFYLPELQ